MWLKVVQTTVITPTYNEAENLPKLVQALFALPIEGLSVLVVDDNSPDGTGLVADQLAAEYSGRMAVLHRQQKLGLGQAYINGFQYALATPTQAIVQMDADLSHPPELLPRMLQALEQADIVLGSRYISGGSVDNHWPMWRKGLSAFGNFYARTILGMSIRDVTGGYRAWRRDVLASLPLERIRSNGYAFLIELTYIAYRLGYTFHETPFYFADRSAGQSKMSLRIQREAALRVLQMRGEYKDLKQSRLSPGR